MHNIGVIGKGAECIIPMMYRILYPDTGATFLSEHDLTQFCETELKTLLGVVLSDPYVHNISVK
jgi:ABC-type enterochelin transport system ATPase subunit